MKRHAVYPGTFDPITNGHHDLVRRAASADVLAFDLEDAVWTIPAIKTKMRREQRVPLSRQALTIIESIETDARLSPLVFPSLRSAKRPIRHAA